MYFDDFSVEHIKSPVVSSQDYYPFGLSFNSNSRENNTPQKFLYQEKEWQEVLGVSLYDFGWRQYDPLNVRTLSMDSHSDSYLSLSPYSWAANNPISVIDPDGQDILYGADAQNYFRQLQAQFSGSSGNQNSGQPPVLSFNSKNRASREAYTQAVKDLEPGFFGGVGNGIVGGAESTLDFFTSLGTLEGWENLGMQGVSNAALMNGMLLQSHMDMGNGAYQYAGNIPNMSAYEIGYGVGFASEKALEIAATRRVAMGKGFSMAGTKWLTNGTWRGMTLFQRGNGKMFRVDFDWKRGLHYHRRVLNNGTTIPGQGIGRHRPWESKSTDGSWLDRF